MNVAITIWGNRISPVVDASRTLLVVAVKDGQIVEQKVLIFHTMPGCRVGGCLYSGRC